MSAVYLEPHADMSQAHTILVPPYVTACMYAPCRLMLTGITRILIPCPASWPCHHGHRRHIMQICHKASTKPCSRHGLPDPHMQICHKASTAQAARSPTDIHCGGPADARSPSTPRSLLHGTRMSLAHTLPCTSPHASLNALSICRYVTRLLQNICA